MRRIEFKSSVSGMTKIFIDGRELTTALDPKVIRGFRITKSKLPPMMGQQLVDTIVKKLENDHIILAKDELNYIIKYVKDELGL